MRLKIDFYGMSDKNQQNYYIVEFKCFVQTLNSKWINLYRQLFTTLLTKSYKITFVVSFMTLVIVYRIAENIGKFSYLAYLEERTLANCLQIKYEY